MEQKLNSEAVHDPDMIGNRWDPGKAKVSHGGTNHWQNITFFGPKRKGKICFNCRKTQDSDIETVDRK